MTHSSPLGHGGPSGAEWSGFLMSVEPVTWRVETRHSGPTTSRHEPLEAGAVCLLDGDLLPRRGTSPMDRETIAHALVSEDLGALGRAHGGYVACAWRPSQRRLFVLRDGIGRWPLYWSQSRHAPQGLVVGTSALEVAVSAGRHRDIDDEAAEEYFQEGFVRPTRTVYRGVEPVPPGDLLVFHWEDGGDRPLLTHSSCRAVPEDGPLCTTDDPRAIHRELRAHLVEATRRIVWDAKRVGVAVTLSGGIDSTLVAALARPQMEDLQAVTLGSLVPLTSDEPWARYAAWRLRARLGVVRPHTTSLLAPLVRSQRFADQPMSPRILNVYEEVIGRTGSAGVVLTGDCADGVFFGAANPAKWTRDAPHPRPIVDFGPPLPEWLGTSGRDQAANHAVGHLLARQYRLGLATGKIIRTPFTDWDVLSYARSMPFEFIFQPNRGKGPLKDQLEGWPAWFLERPKIGFAYQMRWAFLARGELGQLRGLVAREAVERFSSHLDPRLRGDPASWSTSAIFMGFESVLSLVEWTRLERELEGLSTDDRWPPNAVLRTKHAPRSSRASLRE